MFIDKALVVRKAEQFIQKGPAFVIRHVFDPRRDQRIHIQRPPPGHRVRYRYRLNAVLVLGDIARNIDNLARREIIDL